MILIHHGGLILSIIMKKQLKWLRILVFLFLQPAYLFAQTSADTSRCTNFSCCNNDLTPAGVMISHVHLKNEWMVSYRYMNMYMHDLLSGTASENKDDVFATYVMSPEQMSMQMHMLMGMFGITDRLTVMAMLPFQVNSMDMNMYAANHMHGGTTKASTIHTLKTNGLGDVKLQLLYTIFQRSTFQLLANMGVSLPSGSIQKKGASNDPMYPDTRYPYSMQLGSGSVEVLPGITYIYQKNLLALSTSVSGIYRVNYNTIGYKLSPELNITSWIAYQWLNFISSSLRVEGNFSGNIQGADPKQYTYMEPATNPNSYGSKKVSAYVGSTFHLKKMLNNHQIRLEYGLPFYQYASGIQLKQKYTMNASWVYTF